MHTNNKHKQANASTRRSTTSFKRAVNLGPNKDILDAANAPDINVSRICDAFLKEHVRAEQERRWRLDHLAFVEAYNKTIETEELPLNSWRVL
jgi:antitoxin CcdA